MQNEPSPPNMFQPFHQPVFQTPAENSSATEQWHAICLEPENRYVLPQKSDSQRLTNLLMSSRYRKLQAHWAGKHASVRLANSSVHRDNRYPSFIQMIYSQTPPTAEPEMHVGHMRGVECETQSGSSHLMFFWGTTTTHTHCIHFIYSCMLLWRCRHINHVSLWIYTPLNDWWALLQ